MNLRDRDLRQRDLVPSDRLAACDALVIGIGAVGRQAALQLTAMGDQATHAGGLRHGRSIRPIGRNPSAGFRSPSARRRSPSSSPGLPGKIQTRQTAERQSPASGQIIHPRTESCKWAARSCSRDRRTCRRETGRGIGGKQTRIARGRASVARATRPQTFIGPPSSDVAAP